MFQFGEELSAGLLLQVVKIYYYHQYKPTISQPTITLTFNVFALNQNNNKYSNRTIEERVHCRVNVLGSNNPWLKHHESSCGRI
jgi:hypothetical protein